MRRIIGLVLVVTLTIFATLVENYRNNLWVSYRDYRSPYVADIPSGLARTPLSARVVTILIRGLRLSTSQQMPTLNALREKGASFIIQNEPPTFQLPVWTTLISGASTEIHGVTTNQAGRLSNSSSIFREVQLSGGSVAVIGSQSLGDTLGAEVQRFEVVENPDITQRDDDAVRIGLDVLRDSQNPAALICIELTAIEDSLDAHLSDSDAAISATDARIRTIQEKLDLATTTLIIMSDRGLTLPGSDGGGEPATAITPFIMSGAGIAVHSQGLLQSIDIAPTLAALMGVPIPAHSQGEPALAGLVVPVTQPQSQITLSSAPSSTLVVTSTMAPLTALLSGSALQLTTFYEGWSEAIHQPRFASEIFRAQQSAITNGDTKAYQMFVDDLRAHAVVARNARFTAERSQRLPILVGIALFLLVIAGITFTAHRWQPFAGALLYAAVWYGLYTVVLGYHFSLGDFGGSEPGIFFTSIARDSTVVLLVVTILIALTTGRHEDGLDAIATVMSSVLLITCIQIGQAAWFYFQWGAQFTWSLPDSASLVTMLVALTQVSGLSLRLVPELPNIPIPLIIAFLTLIIFTVVRHRDTPGQYGRLR